MRCTQVMKHAQKVKSTSAPLHRNDREQCNRGPVFGIRKALLFSDFERRKKGLLWNFLRNLSGQLRYRGFAFYRLGI
ncbi:putative tyrosine-protein kinase CapB [Dissostichus eleginoides]|uniref:Tyrosine-protein kinase CapB n=1 Tax=Dissostichus eleginoides TaxID=100907 RepID=A0AAD9BTC4_DISEL|nr:putative tyrosine-protein kinase CapB [Dissostichus eleginoides]